MPKRSWGGKRTPGPGKKLGPPLVGAEPTVRRSLSLEPQHWRWLDAQGNASAKVRELVRQAMEGER